MPEVLPLAFEHVEIQRTMNCNFSNALFDRLVDVSTLEDERERVVTSLRYVDDPRLSGPLRAVVFDGAFADEVRLGAYDVLDGVSDYLTDQEQRSIWESGHPGLMRRVLGSLRDADIVVPIANDANHVLYVRSLDALAFGFESHQDLAITALASKNPSIRAAACKTLLWEEAIGAIPGLIECLDDPVEEVCGETENALQYFHDRRVFRSLLQKPGEAFDSLSASFAFALRQCSALAAWMGDLLSVVCLDDTYSEGDTPDVTRKPKPPRPFNVESLLTDVCELGGEWRERRDALRNDLDWASLGASDRVRLGRVLSEHIDPTVRSVAAYAFAAWDEVNGFLGLVGDPNPSVVNSVCFVLGRTSKDQRAARIFEQLLRGDSRIAQWGYVLTGFAHHGSRDAVLRFVEETL